MIKVMKKLLIDGVLAIALLLGATRFWPGRWMTNLYALMALTVAEDPEGEPSIAADGDYPERAD